MVLHTGLTPVREEFDETPPSSANFALDGSGFPYGSVRFAAPPSSDNALAAQFGTGIDSFIDMVDHSIHETSNFFPDLHTYGHIVGPSNGLCGPESHYLPSKPLDMLIAAADVPDILYSLQDQPMDDISASNVGFESLSPCDGFDNRHSMQIDSGQQLQHDILKAELNSTMDSMDSTFVSNATYDMNIHGNTFNDTHGSMGRVDERLAHTQSQMTNQDPLPTSFSISPQKDSFDIETASPALSNRKRLAGAGQDKYYDERPQRPADKPWVRVNSSTMGKTSRTGKINHYDPESLYSVVPHPLRGGWVTPQGREFTYNRWHELTKDCMSASQLEEFIYQHPHTKMCQLTLYIQRSPADSKRRYPTSSLDKCRLKECPMRVHGGNKGTFLHGHYRVALDELSYAYGHGEHNDPFHVAGYVHLYCLERFLDLPALCTLAHVNVEADGRQISKEPNGSFAPALGGGEYRIVTSFLEAARSGQLRQLAEWANYPEHCEYRDGRDGRKKVGEKQHKYTLNYALQMCKNAGRGGRVMSRLKPSNVAVHRGDLEMYCLGRKGQLSDERVADIMAELEKDDRASVGFIRADNRRALVNASPTTGKKLRYAPY